MTDTISGSSAVLDGSASDAVEYHGVLLTGRRRALFGNSLTNEWNYWPTIQQAMVGYETTVLNAGAVADAGREVERLKQMLTEGWTESGLIETREVAERLMPIFDGETLEETRKCLAEALGIYAVWKQAPLLFPPSFLPLPSRAAVSR